jgi:N-acetylmuramoyl-L-alanine amidase
MRKIVLDAGHGGADPGAVGSGIMEKDINLNVALSVYRETKTRKNDYERILTRSTDNAIRSNKSQDLKARGTLGKAADLFISFHCDASEVRTARGFSVYINAFSPDSRKFAEILSKHYAALVSDIPSRGIFERLNSTGKDDYYGVLRPIPQGVPAVIFEMGFISNISDRSALISDTFPRQAAEAVIRAADEFFNIKLEESELSRLTKILADKRRIILDQAKIIREQGLEIERLRKQFKK